MTPGYAKARDELHHLPYRSADKMLIINAHNFGGGASDLLTGLESYWAMEDASGASATDSHGSNTLSVNGAGTIGTGTGIVSAARRLTRANDQSFSRADNASLSVGDIDFTFAGWFNAVTLPSSPDAFDFISKDIESGSDREYLIGFNGTRMRFGVFSGAGSFTQVVANTFGALSTSTWYFICAWHDATNNVLGISINGTEDTLSYSNGVRDAAATFCIGSRGIVANRLDGFVDEIGFWKRMLTSTERSDLYNGGSGLTYPFS
jgi:hypothetical protein